ncbi:hypothetical protein MCEMRE26_01026 [Candidatus Nanopelagicaceae bacterium]
MRKPLAIFALVLAVFLALGFRVTHPADGLKSALGSAKSSIAIYKSNGQALPGDKVLVPVEGSGTQLGVVKSVKSATADVDTGAAFVRVKQSEISGKLIAIIPFFGVPLGWVGL